MTVAVLCYHSTTSDGQHGYFDVPLGKFKDQITRLLDTGVNFIRLDQANEENLISSKSKHVAITFDDGHMSNTRAWEYLAAQGIRPTAFIVSEWSRTGRGENGNGYLGAQALRECSDICDLGAHGATHRPLTDLPSRTMNEEILSSKSYVEDVLGQGVSSFGLPCGRGNSEVLGAVRENGFDTICNSVFELSEKGADSVNRLTISRERSVSFPAEIVLRGPVYWLARRFYTRARNAVAS